MPSAPRTAVERKADTLAKLATKGVDVWVASASASDGAPRAHLVPLSLAWIDERVVLALKSDSLTARNINKQHAARLALGATRDVVIIDVTLDQAVSAEDAPETLAVRYADQADWDPRAAGGGFVYLVLRPQHIQAWREVNEQAGKTVMRAGVWLTN